MHGEAQNISHKIRRLIKEERGPPTVVYPESLYINMGASSHNERQSKITLKKERNLCPLGRCISKIEYSSQRRKTSGIFEKETRVLRIGRQLAFPN